MKRKILIVDDEIDLVTILKGQVNSLQLVHEKDILCAYNGEEALQILKREKDIYLVLSDITMPIKNGLALIKNARELGINCHFIFFTGHGCEEYMKEALLYGAFDFIEKPAIEQLEQAVRKSFAEDSANKSAEKNPQLLISRFRKMLNNK